MTLKNDGRIDLTKEEFCKKVRIRPDHWLFNNIGRNPKFWMYEYNGGENHLDTAVYSFDNDLDSIREFKHMWDYGETWMRVFSKKYDPPTWSLWNTFSVW